jgi:hypothetical protein
VSKKGHVRVIGPTRMEAMLLLMRAYGIARTPLVLKKGWQNPPSLYDDASSSLHDCGAIDAHVERDGNGVVYLVDDMAGRRG